MIKNLLSLIALFLIPISLQAQVWDEDTDGDLSDDHTAPSGPFTLNDGENIFFTNQQGNPSDVDYLTIVVPDGFVLESILLEEYEVMNASNQAFIGIQEGASFTTDASSTAAADLLGGLTYGIDNLDFSLLASMGLLEGSIGFTGPLPAGTYTIWLNQTGDQSFADLNFEVFSETPNEIYIWDEDIDGDPSDDHTNPTGVFNLNQGDNLIYAVQEGNPRDVDYITFTIPSGLQLTELIVDDYTVADASNQAFIGIQEGASFTTDADNTAAADLLGGITYGNADVGTDILPAMGSLGGAIGFTGPLTEGTYTLWLNQTGDTSEVDLLFRVEAELSLDDLQISENDIQLFPNPAIELITLNSQSPLLAINTFDAQGRLVRHKEIENSVNTQINVSDFKSGLYFIQIQTENGTITKRFLKQ